MPVKPLRIENIGPIIQADISFSNLTILVGPQATGKSIFLQILKFFIDTGPVQESLKRYGLTWVGKVEDFLDSYLGEGMGRVWRQGKSKIIFQGREVNLDAIVKRKRAGKKERVFMIPAQRVLTLRDGWPRPFSDYGPTDPFSVREFSEKLRNLMEIEFRREERLFPPEKRLKKDITDQLEKNIFGRFELKINKERPQKRLVLGKDDRARPLPYMVWSAGQREFIPLLLGLYWLLPKGFVSRRKDIEWVVIEEPEMGLHPMAISTVLFIIMDLLVRGYRVCLSTHSPHVLDVVWALNFIKTRSSGDPTPLLKIFQTTKSKQMKEWASKVLKKDTKVYYFDNSGKTEDISALDPGSSSEVESGWGGLTGFSGHVAEVVSKLHDQNNLS